MRETPFPLGRIILTDNARRRLDPEDVQEALRRHACGDWGPAPLGAEGPCEAGLQKGERLISFHESRVGFLFSVITEADLSATIILMPGDH